MSGSGAPGTRRTLVLGAGNVLRGDDGIGVHVVQALSARAGSDATVEYVDAGLRSCDELLLRAGTMDRLIVVDAAHLGEPPGTCRVLRREELGAASQASLHAFGPMEALRLLEAVNGVPAEVVVVAVEPASLEPGACLSPALEVALERICAVVEGAVRPPAGPS